MKHANNILAILVIVTLVLSVVGAVNLTAAPKVEAARIGTKITLYVPPVSYGSGLIPDPYEKSVRQGREAVVAIVIKSADKKCPCGPAVTCRIDGRVMGTSPAEPKQYGPPVRDFWPAGCCGGAMPHMWFELNGKQTARLSVGVHYFTVSYPGNNVYAPSTLTVKFLVSKAPPKPPKAPKTPDYSARINAYYLKNGAKAGIKLVTPFRKGSYDFRQAYNGEISNNGVKEFVTLVPTRTLKDAASFRDSEISGFKKIGYRFTIVKDKNGVSYWYATRLWNRPPSKWSVTLVIGAGKNALLGGRPAAVIVFHIQNYK